MRHLSKLLIVGILFAATIGVGAAGAAPPDPPEPPTIALDITDVACPDGDHLRFSVNATVSPNTAELSYIDVHASRIARVKPDRITYQPTYHQESWGFNWWRGSNEQMPPLQLNTADAWGGSWDHHSVTGLPEAFAVTTFWDVQVWAGAEHTSRRGARGNNTEGSAGQSWTVDCSTGIATPNPDFIWCHEVSDGWVQWDEATQTEVPCSFVP